MRLADFILSNEEPILSGWEVFARSIGAGEHLDQLALRDHAGQILQATARDMKLPQTAAERAKKSMGLDYPRDDALAGSIGMGLYIAREVAKSHNGRIDVTSTDEDGTSFTIRLPRKSAPARP